jgi:hypothetical protein
LISLACIGFNWSKTLYFYVKKWLFGEKTAECVVYFKAITNTQLTQVGAGCSDTA